MSADTIASSVSIKDLSKCHWSYQSQDSPTGVLQSAPVTSKCEWKQSVNVHVLWLRSNCATQLFYHTKRCRRLLAFLNFPLSQTNNEANHYFFSWSNLNTKYWNQGYKKVKTFTFRCSFFFWRKLQEELVKVLVVFRESGNTPTNAQPAYPQTWEFQSQITNTTGYRRTLHMQWLFAVRRELSLLLQGTRSKCIFFIDIYWSPPSQHEQRTIDLPIRSMWKSSNFYRAWIWKII